MKIAIHSKWIKWILILVLAGTQAGLAHAAGIDVSAPYTPPQIGQPGRAAPVLRAPSLGAPSFFGQPSDITADAVLGQPDFTSNADTGASRGRIGYPMGAVHFVRGDSHYLFVADQQYSRILIFGSANSLKNGQAADTVIGQDAFDGGNPNKGQSDPSATSLRYPSDLFVDADGNLYVADYGNNRVLVFKDPLRTDFTADSVFGQGGSFTTRETNLGGRSASSLTSPVSVAVDDQKNVYVADLGNHRVLIYFDPLNADLTADRVIGQGDSFASGDANRGGVTAASFHQPYRVRLDKSGNLYVTDFSNSRGLIFESPIEEDGVADAVVGQPHFFTDTANVGGLTAGIREPCSLGVDDFANLYIADWGNTRVLYYKRPLAEDTLADVVFGQTDTTASGDFAAAAATLSGAQRIDFDPDGNLYISDCYNSRLLKFTIAAVTGRCLVPWMTAPRTGQSVSGNAVSVIAHLAGSGKGVILQFQYRTGKTGAWTALGPDLTSRPYQLKWNTTASAFSDGDTVYVRAAAFSSDCETTYSLPVKVSIKRTGAEVVEDEGSNREKKMKIEKGRNQSLTLDGNFTLDLPASVLDTDGVLKTVAHASNPAGKDPADVKNAKGILYRSMEFENGPSAFRDSVTLNFEYSDTDNDGKIDGTDVPETSAWVFWMAGSDTDWKKVDDVSVNPDSNTVKTKVSHFSTYAVFGSSEPSGDGVVLPKLCLAARFLPAGVIQPPGVASGVMRQVRDWILETAPGRKAAFLYYQY